MAQQPKSCVGRDPGEVTEKKLQAARRRARGKKACLGNGVIMSHSRDCSKSA